MNIKEMQYIITLADTCSITQAAKKLYISQPALSNFLITLEKQLGFKIFFRQNKQLVPTVPGRIYLDYARKILELDNDFHNKLDQWENEIPPIIRVVINFLISKHLFNYIQRGFAESFPDSKIELVEGSGQDAKRMLLEYKAEFSIGSNFEEEEPFQFAEIIDDYFVAAVSKDHPICENIEDRGSEIPAISYDKLMDYLICVRRNPYSDTAFYTDSIITDAPFVFPNLIRDAYDLELPMKRVKNGEWIVIDAKIALMPYKDDSIRFFRLFPYEEKPRKMIAAYNKNAVSSRLAQKLIEASQKCIEEAIEEK